MEFLAFYWTKVSFFTHKSASVDFALGQLDPIQEWMNYWLTDWLTNLLTISVSQWSRILPGKRAVHLVKKFFGFLRTEISLPCPQLLDICSYPPPDKSNPDYLIVFLDPGNCCTLIYSMVFKWFLSCRFPHTNRLCI